MGAGVEEYWRGLGWGSGGLTLWNPDVLMFCTSFSQSLLLFLLFQSLLLHSISVLKIIHVTFVTRIHRKIRLDMQEFT